MKQHWQQWVAGNQGRISHDGYVEFADGIAQVAAVRQGDVLALLDKLRLIRVEGEDAQAFLQSQLSSDIRELSESQAQYSSYSTAKGRMLASFLICQQQGGYLLLLAADIAEAVAKRLSMFVMRSKVKVALLAADQMTIAGVRGNKAEQKVKDHFAAGAVLPMSVLHAEQELAIALPGGGFVVLLGEDAPLQAVLLQEPFHAVDANSWAIRDIDAGIAWVTLATQEQFVPQMANMEVIGAVSFKKGCYPGQEIVARTQYLGKLKRRLFKVRIRQFTSAGSKLFSPELPEQAIGMVAAVCAVDNDRYEALVVVQSACWEKGIYLEPEYLSGLECLALPYSTQDE